MKVFLLSLTSSPKSPQHTAILSLSVEDVVQQLPTHFEPDSGNGNLPFCGTAGRNYRTIVAAVKLRKNRHGLPELCMSFADDHQER